MDVTKLFKKSRGSGRGTGQGRGRGRGRGRGFVASKAFNVVDVEDDDNLCNMALEQAELDNNSITKSFEELNAASQLDGFDSLSGGIWIYPTNRPVRDYQYDIVKTALFHNTLVSLPTGLGKTFISAVVMYNYQRWYPSGIIVFMAPTRPLVTQQLDACHNTVGISPAKTVELTGQIAPKKRQQLWQTKTVFFLTPQVMLSDLERNFFPPENVRCIVVDEAHKALGNHAYVQVIAKILEKNRLFRVLALSATPGSDIIAVKQVFKNLLISRVELRNENSPDILPYVHDKKVEKVVVKLDPYLTDVHSQILEVFQTYSGKLLKANALTGRDGTSYSKFQLLKAREVFRKDLATKLPNFQKGYIEVDFAICISLAHAIETLLSHGLRTFYIFLSGVLNKEKGCAAVTAELNKNTCLQNLLDDIQRKLSISVANSTFEYDLSTTALFSAVGSPKVNIPNRSFIQEDTDFSLSHPKLKVLKDIVHKHFLDYQMRNATTRVMIFSQYRDSVQEIGNMLNSLRPLVKPMVFIGQANTSATGRGLKQKDQVQVVQQFRDGGFNVLVSTSVGEEGLDIGEVDLIICFDASKSPTRLIQRMGRTGRKREGRTVFLLTQGKEERSYCSSLSLHTNISKSITDPTKLQPFLYKSSPRMVPTGIDPDCFKMSIILSTEQSSQIEPMQIDLADEDSNLEPVNPLPKKRNQKKQANVGKKKKKDTAGTSANKPTTTEKDSASSIAKLFERMNKASSQNSCQKGSELSTKQDLPVIFENEDAYCLEDGMHLFAMNNVKAFNSMSVYPKTFDINRPDRLEWKPCTTFVKSKPPMSASVETTFVVRDLGALLLSDKELSAVDFGIKSRESFSYLKTDYCGCGNIIEPHEVERDPPCYNVIKSPRVTSDRSSKAKSDFFQTSATKEQGIFYQSIKQKDSVVNRSVNKEPAILDRPLTTTSSVLEQSAMQDSIILDKPFIEEEFEEFPEDFLETFQSLSPSEFTGKIKASTSPSEKEPTKTPSKIIEIESSSDEDIRSEYSASPEIGQNRFLQKLKEIKAGKVATSAPSPINIETSLPPPVDTDVKEIISVLNVSTKKFKFKKKKLFSDPAPDEQEQQIQTDPPLDHGQVGENNHEMSPSPPLSPILKLPTVVNDLFKSPGPPAPSTRDEFEDVANHFFEDDCDFDFFPANPTSHNESATVNTSPWSPVISKLSKTQKPVQFSEWTGNQGLPAVSFDDIEESTGRKTNDGLKSSTLKPTISKTTNPNKGLGRSMPEKFDAKRQEGNLNKKATASATACQGSTDQHSFAASSSASHLGNKNRTSVKVVKPAIREYTPSEIKAPVERPEPPGHRPIVRTFSSSVSADITGASAAKYMAVDDEEDDDIVSVSNKYTKESFRKSPSTSSAVSSTTSYNTFMPPVRNLLSRNRPKKPETTELRTLSRTRKNELPVSSLNSIKKQATPPRLRDPDLSDDSPEIIFTKRKSPSPPPFYGTNNQEQSPVTPLSFRRSGNPNRYRISDSVSASRSVTRSPTTPTHKRFSFSRRRATFDGSPVSHNVSRTVSPQSANSSPFVIEHRNAAKRGRKKGKTNPFIETEATVSGDDSDTAFGDENEFEFEGLDDMDDSFVTNDDDDTGVTDSQQVMYLESVKDAIPARFGRIEKPLSPKNYGRDMDTTGESYEDDSFCQQDDDVEYMDVGVFTQAMNQAKVELAVSNSGRQTRSGKREAMANQNSGSNPSKQRRRVVMMDDSSDDDDFK